MNDTTTRESSGDVHCMVRSGAEGACMEACEQPCATGLGTSRPTAIVDGSNAVTKAQILAAMHEYAWTFHGYHGRGPDVEAKHAAVAALLDEAGIQ